MAQGVAQFPANIELSSLDSGDDILLGGAGDDEFLAAEGNDVVDGGAGNDRIAGGEGDDTLDGGSAIDKVDYTSASAGVTVDLALTGPQDTAGAGIDTLGNIENATGSRFGDRFWGTDGANVLEGGYGDDKLFGRGGNDTLHGGRDGGDDRLSGGTGIDTVSYTLAAGGGVAVDLELTIHQYTGGAGFDRLSNIENATGSHFGDSFWVPTGQTS